jgi:hypothetical protein
MAAKKPRKRVSARPTAQITSHRSARFVNGSRPLVASTGARCQATMKNVASGPIKRDAENQLSRGRFFCSARPALTRARTTHPPPLIVHALWSWHQRLASAAIAGAGSTVPGQPPCRVRHVRLVVPSFFLDSYIARTARANSLPRGSCYPS